MSGRSPKYNFLQSVFFVLMFLAAVYVLARSPFFEVREIMVEGNNSLSAENIISVSGINPGENIFKINLKLSAERIRVLPVVKRVDMSRKLPSTVAIRVEERKPLALLPVDGGFIQVDDEGVHIQKGDIASNQLPVVTGVTFAVPEPGGRIMSGALKTALAVVGEIPPGLLPQLSEINIDGDQITAYTLDGIQCRLGSASGMKQKGEVFMKVLSELKAKGKRIEYIDLSYTGTPVVKYVE